MAEKGGKGFSLPRTTPKSSLKSPVSMKGKDDSTTKSKRGRKVQFDAEDSLESKINLSLNSGEKADIPFGKGGKGDKTANGGKSFIPKESSILELKIEQELSKNAKFLMDCEAADILQGIQEQMVILSEDPTIKIPPAFDKGLQYAKSGSHYSSPQSVRQVLEPLRQHGVSDSEVCLMANIFPESIDEIFALIPSLKGKEKVREPLQDALRELANLKSAS
ncbi:DNA-directed RNA polymerases IV and V subunit 4-like isoform X2 [Diospyros lotus]|uniref:DNA-directed RNA polymerases IV and V subunit 4-like isoform X2 n=1 Tax=Diospyros lotus TaxID=55363 RepID=UPI002250A0A6|nr:DNA-directed RNA polymerases IV and V subunit 4-like isoform X2 [Diospyros lotus]XP_052201254.1 DNA-directed RNA polymerases IV and V subunit 4-like isoform X2 [Diospyros lotus]XP_052201255.1 DNA-directed RNA polymerases IV and V subunit 4-like isoform X2 [Diospyros lotus]XP_052201256.1 DNA-directed RNA polymerases IV and V subunit 4-like isoform X2 [Diospyros lotus]XP_052201257.1 DNA-directed RNA polymerases IV and V subunit 4-like isoform X2 [Diospyros lotus]XP_052201258.1 DNA-directed RN